VPQTLVSFGHHQLLSPSPDETSARQTLQNCLLSALLKQAGSNLVDGIGRRRALQARQQQQGSHLRALERQQDSGSHGEKSQQELNTARQSLQATEGDLSELKTHLADVNDHLTTLIEGLEQAPESIRINTCDLNISRTNVKLSPENQHDGIRLNLAEVCLGDTPPRVVSLTRYPRTEFKSAA
jgi:chromosome segregation ATPase